MKYCSIDGCNNKHRARGWCDKHYKCWWQYGDALWRPIKEPIRLCKIKTCDRRYDAKGYCHRHYRRYKKFGDAMEYTPIKKQLPWGTALKKFKNTIQSNKVDNCIFWQPSETKNKYGTVTFMGKNIAAHRLSLILFVSKPDKTNNCALHRCGNTRCVNPKHLYWGTYWQNAQDKIKDGNSSRGVKHHMNKLSVNKVRYIRKSKLNNTELGKMFMVTPGAIRAIRIKRSWSWLDD